MSGQTQYFAVIQRTSDSAIRRCPQACAWQEGSWFWWADGTYSCDCNRHLEFERAAGHSPAMDEDIPCGASERYRVLRFEFPDGRVIDGPDSE